MTVLDILDLVIDFIGVILEVCFADFQIGNGSPGLLSSRTFWVIVILILGGIIWLELR